MRIGIYGGSFSPIHTGHLLLAESCRDQLQLDEVWFVPVAVSPLKQDTKPASDAHRLAMIDLAIAGHVSFRVQTVEMERQGVSYTIDTLNQFRETHPDNDFYFLLGGDSLASLHLWREVRRICELAQICHVSRHEAESNSWQHLEPVLTQQQIEAIRQHHIEMPRIELSSSDIRQRLANGRSIRYMLPRSVEKYIETHKLFQVKEKV